MAQNHAPTTTKDAFKFRASHNPSVGRCAGDQVGWLKHVPMNHYQVQLHISSEAYLDYYRGAVRHVIARSASGQTVQFPASLLQRFVTTEGIHGVFELTSDEKNKCISLQRLETNN